jgi:dTDP-L-rhamnose 4-epimerase
MSETVLVTGGAGFIGSHLVDGLLDAGYRVRVLDNLEPQVHGNLRENGERPAYLDPDAEFICGDVRNRELLSKVLNGVTVVFHQAALVGVGQSMYEIARYTDANVNGTAVLLQAIVNAKQRPRKIIVASSMSIYGEGAYKCPMHGSVYPDIRTPSQLADRDWELYCPLLGCSEHVLPCPTDEIKPLHPTSIYAINKRDQEEMFMTIGRAYDIPAVALRYFNTYGTRQALGNPYTGVAAIFSSRLLNGNPPVIFEDGNQSRDFVHVTDIVQANLLAMNSDQADYKTFNVGTGCPITILDVATILSKYFDELSVQSQSNGGGAAYHQAEITHQFRAGDIRHCFSDISRLRELGYQPNVRFEDGVQGLMDWVIQQTSVDSFENARRELANRGLAT